MATGVASEEHGGVVACPVDGKLARVDGDVLVVLEAFGTGAFVFPDAENMNAFVGGDGFDDIEEFLAETRRIMFVMEFGREDHQGPGSWSPLIGEGVAELSRGFRIAFDKEGR